MATPPPPFTGLSPLSRKKLPQVTQFLESPTPPFNKGGGGGGGGGVPTTMNPKDVMVVVLKDIILYLLGFRFIYIVYIS